MATNSQSSPANGSGSLGPGAIVGGTWVVERLLGKGGMGAVWLARHQRLANKLSAIKVLLGTGLRDEAYLRFAREAEIATRIGHPNIVDVIDMDSLPSGEPYIVLEFLAGEDLRSRLKRQGALSYADTCAITRQIGSALQAAHRQDVVHRDLKPENVFLVPTDSGGVIRDHVKVLDFGISKLRGSQTVQTQEAMLLGTPQYMAPEQAAGRNQDVDARTDQFALAVMVYEMVTGQPPWVADTPLGLLFQVVHSPTPALGSKVADLPEHAVAAIEKALSKDAAERFADVGAFVEALTGAPLAALDSKKPDTRPLQSVARRTGPVATSTSKATHVSTPEVELATIDGALPADSATVFAPDAGKRHSAPPPKVAEAPAPAPEAEPPSAVAAQTKAKRPPLALFFVAGVLVCIVWLIVALATPTPAPVATPVAAPAADAHASAPADAAATPAVAVLPTRTAEPPQLPPAALPAPVSANSIAPFVAVEQREHAVAQAEAPPDVVQAEAAAAAEKWDEAERLAVRSLTVKQTPAAFAVLAKAHCQRKDAAGARTWFGQIKATAAKLAVRAHCAAKGVSL